MRKPASSDEFAFRPDGPSRRALAKSDPEPKMSRSRRRKQSDPELTPNALPDVQVGAPQRAPARPSGPAIMVAADGTVIRSGSPVAARTVPDTQIPQARGPVAAPTHLTAVPTPEISRPYVTPSGAVTTPPSVEPVEEEESDDFAFGSVHSSRASRAPKPKRRRRFWPALLVGVLVAGAAGAYTVVAPDNTEPVSFRYAYQQGQNRTYDMTMEMDMKPVGGPDIGPVQGTMHATMNMDVISTREDGSSVIEIAMSNISVEPSPTAAPSDFGKLRVSIAPEGRITSIEGFGGPFGAAGLDLGSLLNLPGVPTDSAGPQFLFPQFPSEGVRPGDTWSEETNIPLPFSDQPMTVQTEGRFDGFEESQYGRAAKMHHISTIPLNLDFTMAEISDAMSKLSEGAAIPDVPPEAAGARFIISGQMKTVTDSLVLPAAGDAVKMDGTTTMSVQMRLEGLAAGALQSTPSEFGMDGTMKMSIIRVDGQSAL